MTARKLITFTLLSVAILFALGNTASASIPAKKHNQVLKKIELASGKRYQRRSKAVSLNCYKFRKSQLQTLRSRCRKEAQNVRGTYYGGSGDPSSGVIGYRGDDLTTTDNTFAELSTNPFGKLDFAALGGLPYKAKRWIHNGRRSELGVKRDIGAGGSRYPKIDLWHTLAAKLHFTDGFVRITKRPCRGVFK